MRRLAGALAAASLAGCAGQPAAAPSPAVAAPSVPVTMADGPVALANAGFDVISGAGANCPPAWECTAHVNSAAFTFAVVTDPSTGNRFLRVSRVKPEPWALVTRTLPGKGLAGKRLSLAFRLNTENVQGQAGPVIMLQGPDGRVVAHRQVLEAPAKGWRTARAEIDVPAGVHLVEFGILLEGGGAVDADDASLEVVTPRPS